MKCEDRNKIAALTISIVAILIIICIGLFDIFAHGNFCDVVNPSDIDAEDFVGLIDLGEGPFTSEFVPQKRHFVGFELNLVNIPKENAGVVVVSVADSKGKILDLVETDLNKIVEQQWYRIYLDVTLRVGRRYVYTVEAKNCSSFPSLQIVDDGYLGKESNGNGILIGYIYAESTFSPAEKFLFGILIVALWLFGINKFLLNKKQGGGWNINTIVLILVMIFGMSWNFMYNSLDNHNDSTFSTFQEDSEALVRGMIYAEQKGIELSAYGLGRFTDLCGEHKSREMSFLTDNNWHCGYSRWNPQILVLNTDIAKKATSPGNYIQFSNGETFLISQQENSNPYLVITLKTDKALNYYKYGDLLDAVFFDADMKPIETVELSNYKAQYGLQGKIFQSIAHCIYSEDVFQILNVLCCIAAGIVFSIIVYYISKKYNILMAGCFFIVFLLSPWIVNFAKNLYWVEFTWFIPMLVGLFCSVHIDNKKYRSLSYFMAFIAVLIKSLCGYEYITAVMLGSIIFLLTDMLLYFINGDKKRAFSVFKVVFIIGIAALLGFIAAICIHANIRGEGDVLEGIKSIIDEDMLRRTLGGDMNNFDGAYWASFNASLWDVLKKYFHFRTEVIAGVASNLFPIICITPIMIFVHNYKQKRLNQNDVILYILNFITSVSWYILGKQHSYIHTHMNYVLWYFGYIQICIYIIVKQIMNMFDCQKTDKRI